MSELVASTTREEWQIRIQKPGQRTVRFITSPVRSFKTKEEALARIEEIKDKFPLSSLGVQWQRVTVESNEVDWVHNRP